MKAVLWAFAAFLAGAAAPAEAQNAAALGGGELSLDAADGVEWRREERLFVAEGSAVARQGDVTLQADRLVAAYRDKPGGGFEIFRVDAEGDVAIRNGEDAAKGVRAAFDLEARAILLTGPGVSYTGKVGAVTAEDSLEYDLKTRRAVARGRAVVEADRGRISADAIEASFSENSALAAAKAWGGVAIRTANETIRAAEAEYDAGRELAVARGDVRIQRGQNVLSGARATVDFRSGISRLEGDAGERGGRVKGLVFPKAQ